MSPSIRSYIQSICCLLVCSVSLSAAAAHLPQVIPTTTSEMHPYNLTGIILSTEVRSMGSGAVVRYPKVVISCAHVVYDYTWRNGNYFVRGWNKGTLPRKEDGTLLRGYSNFGSYSGDYDFSSDFVAHYAYENLAGGSYGGWAYNGAAMVGSARSKMIVGYPAGIYEDDHVDQYRMHKTGPFSLAFEYEDPNFYGVEQVSTGPGNSGGPVWVNEGGQWLFSGVLVAGLAKSLGDPVDVSGIFVMGGDSWDLVDSACISAGGVAPSIVSQPADVYTYLTQTATLTATASGLPNPSLRWQINSGGGWVDLFGGGGYTGTASSALKLLGVNTAHGAVQYRLSAANIAGVVYSNPARVIPVAPPVPTITRQPANRTLLVGSNAFISVAATGIGNLSYQWRKDGVDLAGATNFRFAIESAQTNQSGNYRVVVRNEGGSVLSQVAVVTVLPRFFLTTATLPVDGGSISVSPEQPIDGYISGTMVTATVTPNGTNELFGWTGGANGTSNVLTFKMDNHKTVTAHFGDSRLILQNRDGRLQTWFMNGTEFLGAAALRKLGPGWRMVGAHDFNADSSHDFLIQHTDGRVAVWKMNKNNFMEAVLVRNAGLMWRAVGVADFNNDGEGDILFQNADNRLAVWYLQGTTFTNAALIRGGVPIAAGWKAVAVHDFDVNGSPDIIFQHNDGGRMVIWLLDGTSLLSAVKVRNGLSSGNWKLFGLSDFNDDNKMDLIMLNTDGRTAVWFMDGVVYTSAQILRNGAKLGPDWSIVGSK